MLYGSCIKEILSSTKILHPLYTLGNPQEDGKARKAGKGGLRTDWWFTYSDFLTSIHIGSACFGSMRDGSIRKRSPNLTSMGYHLSYRRELEGEEDAETLRLWHLSLLNHPLIRDMSYSSPILPGSIEINLDKIEIDYLLHILGRHRACRESGWMVYEFGKLYNKDMSNLELACLLTYVMAFTPSGDAFFVNCPSVWEQAPIYWGSLTIKHLLIYASGIIPQNDSRKISKQGAYINISGACPSVKYSTLGEYLTTVKGDDILLQHLIANSKGEAYSLERFKQFYDNVKEVSLGHSAPVRHKFDGKNWIERVMYD